MNKIIIPEGTREIDFNLVCDSLSSEDIREISLPSSLEVIRENTFFDFPNIKVINIPRSVRYIGKQAFFGLDELSSVTLHPDIEHIERHAFINCKNLVIRIVGTDTFPSGWDKDFAVYVQGVEFNSEKL